MFFNVGAYPGAGEREVYKSYATIRVSSMKLPPPVDKIDIVLLCGLFILGMGLWLYDPRLSLCVVGAIVSVMAIIGALRN